MVISSAGNHEEKLEEALVAVLQSSEESGQYVTEVDVTISEDSSESQEGSGEEFLPGTEVSFSLEKEEDEKVEEEEAEE